jgi:predicted Zn-dependent protease
VVVTNRGAAALLLNAQDAEAVALFRKGIEAHPESAALQLNLGLALSMLGRHREAASTLQVLLEKGLTDDFLVYKTVAREHELLEDARMSHKSQALYIQKIDAALEEALR